MPQGVEVLVEDGYATVEFVDPELRAAGLNALLQAGGDQVQKVTRPRPAYVVPEGVARTAGLLDEATEVVAEENDGADPVAQTWPDGEPEEAWRRDELDAYALAVHDIDTTDLPKKEAVLAAINDAKDAQ